MNGSKSTFKQKGYWLTAFAAAVLLAASPGTASAQTLEADSGFDSNGLKVEVANVDEGDSATITVSVKAKVIPALDPANDAATNRTVSVTVTADAVDSSNAADYDATKLAEDTDYGWNPPDADNPNEQTKSIVFPDDTEDEYVVRTATFTLPTNADPDAEDEDINISVETGDDLTITGEDGEILTIEDLQTQTYVLTLSSSSAKAKEGDDVMVSIKADPAHVNGSEMLVLNLDRPAPDYRVTPAEVILASANDSEMDLTVTTDNEDGNRVSDTVTLTAYSGVAGRSNLEDSLEIKLADLHELPAVAVMVTDKDGKEIDPKPTSVTEGDSIWVVVMPVDEEGDALPGGAGEDLEVALNPTGTADSADYEVVRTIEIDAGEEKSAPVELEVAENDDIGRESLMFDAVVSGDLDNGPGTLTSAGVLSLYIEDVTEGLITPKTSEADYDAIKAVIAAAAGDDGLNPDPAESFMLMFSDLFTVEDGYTATYSFSQAGTSVSTSSNGESITVTAEMAGRTEITINGTARLPVSSLEGSQAVANDASIKFPVEVVDGQLVVTVSADPMEVEAGGTSMITAAANRAVTAGDGAVTIELTVVGDGTVDPASITIAMGAMSGSAMLTANEKVTVVATGSGITTPMQVVVDVTEAPEPVPALPLIGQLLLGLGLLGGGARHLYRRRQG